MDRDPKNGFPIRAPQSIYDASYVKSNGLAKKTGDVTGLGHHPSGGIPGVYQYFGHPAGRKNSKSENKQAPTLGNKWRRK